MIELQRSSYFVIKKKAKGILCSDWLPEHARWTYIILPVRDFTRWSRKKFFFGHTINLLLTELVRSTWLDIGLFFFH